MNMQPVGYTAGMGHATSSHITSTAERSGKQMHPNNTSCMLHNTAQCFWIA